MGSIILLVPSQSFAKLKHWWLIFLVNRALKSQREELIIPLVLFSTEGKVEAAPPSWGSSSGQPHQAAHAYLGEEQVPPFLTAGQHGCDTCYRHRSLLSSGPAYPLGSPKNSRLLFHFYYIRAKLQNWPLISAASPKEMTGSQDLLECLGGQGQSSSEMHCLAPDSQHSKKHA